ncbi:MAG: biliverdin-producing heme oxygenase [Congregibacter sp.]
MNSRQEPSVRRLLATRTASVHEALHAHSWISSLQDPSLTQDRYRLLLAAYYAFLSDLEAERARLDCYPLLSLGDQIANLKSDLEILPGELRTLDVKIKKPGGKRAELLGSLYVIHGAGFGAASLTRHVKRSLPDASRHYLERGTSAATWRVMLGEIESLAGSLTDIERLVSGAAATFDSFGGFISAFCEANQSWTARLPASSKSPS